MVNKEATIKVAQQVHQALATVQQHVIQEGYKPEYDEVFLNVQHFAYKLVSFMSEKAFLKLAEQEQAIAYAIEDYENGKGNNIQQAIEPIRKSMERAAKKLLENCYKIQSYNTNTIEAEALVPFYIAVDKEVSKILEQFTNNVVRDLENVSKT